MTSFYTYRDTHGAEPISPNYDGAITVPDQNVMAFHYSTDPQTVQIPIHHINLNNGFSIPIINDSADDTMVLTAAHVIWDRIQPGLDATKFIIICCQKRNKEPQLLIFRAAVAGKRIINLPLSDVVHMEAVAKR